MFIKGKHSIYWAMNNSKRGKMTLYGNKDSFIKYDKYNNLSFVNSPEEKLEVKEYFIPSSFEDIKKCNRLILLDHILDPRNFGAIIRSAAILNYGVIYRSHGCPINETVVRCAEGGVDKTPIIKIDNLSSFIKKIKEEDYWCYFLDENAEFSLKDIRRSEKILLIIGGEDGLSSLAKKLGDIGVKLMTKGDITTYNASVAASIAMYCLA